MERTKYSKPTMERTKKKKPTEIDPETFVSPHGGFLPFPPEGCRSTRIQVDNLGVRYTDMVICGNVCKGTKCVRYNQYRKVLDKAYPTAYKVVRNV